MSFSSLDLSPLLLRGLNHNNYDQATAIQKLAIPAVLAHKDVLGIAKTGSGKTAAFVLPILEKIKNAKSFKHREPVVLVLVPTRELADQVAEVFEEFIPYSNDSICCKAIYGGVSVNVQMQTIGKADVVVATPGRLLDLLAKNSISLSAISTLVLDEADKMLSLGFKTELEEILALLPKNRQNLLFSATLSEDLAEIEKVLLKDPEIIKIVSPEDSIDLINQQAYAVSEERKGPLLRYLIKSRDLKQVLVFSSSVAKADRIVNKLCKNKIRAAAIHSKKSQHARREALEKFKTGKLQVLVATDLLSRGIDIEFLPCVINYELPRSPKDYIHRIGRTGRAESSGDAISLISPKEEHHFRVIQKKMGQRVEVEPSDEIDLHAY